MIKASPRRRIMAATSMAHFINDVSELLLPSVLPVVIAEFRLSYAAAGLVIASSSLLMTSLQAAVGYIADRVNRIALLFAGLMVLGLATLLVGSARDYLQLLMFQCLLGTGASVYHPVGYSLLSDAYETSERGSALGLGSAAGDVAAPVAFLTSGFLTLIFGWRNVFVSCGLAVIVAALIVPFTTSEPRKKVEATNLNKPTREVMLGLIPIIVVMALMSACYRIVSAFITTYLTTLGFGIELANVVAAVMMIVGIIGAVAVGFLTDKLGERSMIFGSSILLGATSAILIGIREGYLFVPIICLMGFPLLGVWPALYSAIARATSKGARAFTYGTIFAITWGGGAFFPYIAGAAADIFGLESIYIMVTAFSLIAAATAYFKLKEGFS